MAEDEQDGADDQDSVLVVDHVHDLDSERHEDVDPAHGREDRRRDGEDFGRCLSGQVLRTVLEVCDGELEDRRRLLVDVGPDSSPRPTFWKTFWKMT